MTEPDYAHNRVADAARTLKAAYIMDACFAAGLTADDVAHLEDPKRRRALEKAAGTHRGSDETWRLVATLMARESPYRRQTADA